MAENEAAWTTKEIALLWTAATETSVVKNAVSTITIVSKPAIKAIVTYIVIHGKEKIISLSKAEVRIVTIEGNPLV